VRSQLKRSRKWTIPAIAVTLSLAAAACGGDDDDTAATAATTATTVAESSAPTSDAAPGSTVGGSTETTTAGTEPAADAECGQPGFSSLEPKPLDERASVTISAAGKLEAFAPAFIADANGEFEKENIDVEFVITQTAVQALATGEADAALSAPSLEMINAIRQDVQLSWIAGNYYPDPESKIGLYARTDLVGAEPDWSKLAGQQVSLTNPAGLTLLTLNNRLTEKGVSLADVEVVRMAPADALIALENGALGAAWLNAPIHLEVADNPDYQFVGGQDADFVGGGLIAGPGLLEQPCEVTVGLLRAMERTIQSTLAPGYKSDPATVTQLAEVLEIPEESITGNEELLFTQRIPDNEMGDFQDSLIEFGLMPEADRVPDDQLFDMSFLDSIDGAK
jgi:NitT/TauT family transport system substrate-binding protein